MYSLEELITNEYRPEMDVDIARLSDNNLRELFHNLNNHLIDQGTYNKIKTIATALEYRNREAINHLQFNVDMWLPQFIGKDVSSFVGLLDARTTFGCCAVASYLFTGDSAHLETWQMNDLQPLLDDTTRYTWAEKVLITIYVIEHKTKYPTHE